ncbi:MAG: hypothetical protein SWY16_27105 [Cyanobacteriota bacterium]|nr:hypothetical protein [Cyanobacteriota bacterium]
MRTSRSKKLTTIAPRKYSRNSLLHLFRCGRHMLQGTEDIAFDLIPDFREGLRCDRARGVVLPDGSVQVQRCREGWLDAYHVWVLKEAIAIWRKHKGDRDKVYDRLFKKRNRLTYEAYRKTL